MSTPLMKRLFLATTAMAAMLTLSVAPAAAGPFTDIFVFGDSLSDTGNLFVASGGTTPTAPYYNGRFSDGPVWVEGLAAGLGLDASSVAPALLGGQNFAFGGARTGLTGPVPGVLAQLVSLWEPDFTTADPDALYVLVGGSNSMRDARSAAPSSSAADQAVRQAAADAAMNDLISGVGFLAARGAKHVLVSNLPDLGLTPEAAGLGLAAPSTDASSRFNALVPSLLATGEGAGLNMYLLDLAGLFDSVRFDALTNGGGVYGITNALTPCGSFSGSFGISCNVSLFSDALHPSARTHALIAAAALDAKSRTVPVPVPEPATLSLLGLGVVVAAGRRRSALRRQ
jgi:outer membrane lipase/esterase